MSLGLVCHWLEKNSKGVYENILGERSLQLTSYNNKKYSNDYIHEVYKNNITNLQLVLDKILRNNIKCYRISSSLFPLSDIVNRDMWDNSYYRNIFKKYGEIFKKNNIRITCHPGQFVSLTSSDSEVIRKSIAELDYHAWMFDSMELDLSPYYAINIHGGKRNSQDILIKNINNLPTNIKSRLTLENDECSYNVLQLKYISENTDVPICFDSHHHTFNTGNLTINEAFLLANKTWKGKDIKPLQHLSNTNPEEYLTSFQDRRKHSDFVHYFPAIQYEANLKNEIDVEMEFKMKNIAIFDWLKKTCSKIN